MSDLSRVLKAVSRGDAGEVEDALKDMSKKYGPGILGAGVAGPLGLVLAKQIADAGKGKGPLGRLPGIGRPGRGGGGGRGGPDFEVLDKGCVNPMTGRASEPVSLNALITLAAAGAIAADTAVAANDVFRTASSAFLSENNKIPGGFHAFEISVTVSLANVAARVETVAHAEALYFVEEVNNQEVARPAFVKCGLKVTDGGIVTSGGGATATRPQEPAGFNRRYLTDIPYKMGIRSPVAFTPTAAIVINVNLYGYRSRGAS